MVNTSNSNTFTTSNHALDLSTTAARLHSYEVSLKMALGQKSGRNGHEDNNIDRLQTEFTVYFFIF